MESKDKDTGKLFTELYQTVAELRDPVRGCPWDKELTHQSLKRYLIEESYETIQAIDEDIDSLPKELGDLLLQVLLHAVIGMEKGTFNIDDVLSKQTQKLIDRHPHVFDENAVKYKTAEEVSQAWEKNKKKKLKAEESILDGVPKTAPELFKAHIIGEKCNKIGFDWKDADTTIANLIGELQELKEELSENNPAKIADELGDVLFSAAQVSRKLGFNSEEILKKANDKFTRRFKAMEKKGGDRFTTLNFDEMHDLWDAVKKEEKSRASLAT